MEPQAREGSAPAQGNYQGNLGQTVGKGYSPAMATKTRVIHCTQCDHPEKTCECEKYCCLCQAQVEIRLCTDGLYYCKPCREACGYELANETSPW